MAAANAQTNPSTDQQPPNVNTDDADDQKDNNVVASSKIQKNDDKIVNNDDDNKTADNDQQISTDPQTDPQPDPDDIKVNNPDDDSLEIISVELYLVSIPFVSPYKLAVGTFDTQTNVICKINTNKADMFGFGEASPLIGFTEESTDSIWTITKNEIFSLIKNKNALKIDDIENILDTNIDDVNVMAKGMINMALWDIYGKYHSKPVYQCLSDKIFNKSIPLLYPFSDQTIEQDTKMLNQKMSQGYKTFMLKMGVNMDIDYEIKRVKAVEKTFGPIGSKLYIVCDANQGFTFEQSMKFIKGCSGIKMSFFEQPINKKEYDKLKVLKEECIKNGFDLSLDESIQDMKAIKYALKNDIGSVFSVKVSKNGGISKLFTITKMCKQKGIKCLFNSMLEFGIAQASLLSVIAVTPNIVQMGHCFMSTLRFKDDITDFTTLISNDKIVSLSNKPGLGITVNQAKLESYSSKIEKLN